MNTGRSLDRLERLNHIVIINSPSAINNIGSVMLKYIPGRRAIQRLSFSSVLASRPQNSTNG